MGIFDAPPGEAVRDILADGLAGGRGRHIAYNALPLLIDAFVDGLQGPPLEQIRGCPARFLFIGKTANLMV